MAAAYDASSIVVYQGLEAVRRRPGMYVGDPQWPDAVAQAVRVLVAYGAFAGSRHIVVTIESNLTFSVLAEGVGIPRAENASESALERDFESLCNRHCITPATALLGYCHPEFVNALSESFVVETVHDGILRRAAWQRGNAVSAETDVGPASHPRILARVTLDGAIYGTSHPAAWEYFVALMADSAVVVPGLRIHLWDKRRTTDATREFHAPGGLEDRVRELGAITEQTHPIYSSTWTAEHNLARLHLALTWIPTTDCEIQTLCPHRIMALDGILLDAITNVLDTHETHAMHHNATVTRGLRAVIASNSPSYSFGNRKAIAAPLVRDLPRWLAANPRVGPTANR